MILPNRRSSHCKHWLHPVPRTTIDSFSHLYDRGGNLTVNGKPSFTVDQAATQLLRDGAAYQDKDGSGKIELTYTFLTSASSSTMNKHGITGFSQFSAQQKAQAALAMQSWADVANVTFTEKATRRRRSHDLRQLQRRPGRRGGLCLPAWHRARATTVLRGT